MPMGIRTKKRAVMVIAKQGFQYIEYNDTRKALEAAGVEIIVASSSSGQAVDKLGQSVVVDKTLEEIKTTDFDALIFIGGSGALEYADSASAHQLAREAVDKEKILAAICIAPTILAKAGTLKGKKATVWSNSIDRAGIQVLKENGAEYIDRMVVVDGRIVTANGPSAAVKFGQKIIELLNEPSF